MYSLNKQTMTTSTAKKKPKHRPLSASDKRDPGGTCKAKGRKKTTKTNKKSRQWDVVKAAAVAVVRFCASMFVL